MLKHIRHPKLNTGIYLYSKSDEKQECVQKTDYKSEQKTLTRNQSANVKNTGGFFSPKNQDSITFSGNKPNDFWTKLGENKHVQKFLKNPKVLKFFEKATGLAVIETYFIFAISTTIKPLSIMAMPGAKKEDKEYNATKSFLVGIVDFCLVMVALKPIEKRLEKFCEKIKEKPQLLNNKVKYLAKEENRKTFKTVMGYAPKFFLIPLRGLLTIALIPPTLKILFPEEAKKLNSKKPKNQTPQNKAVSAGGAK